MSFENTVFWIKRTESASCLFCMLHNTLTNHDYRRGQVFLAGAGHSPCDGNANFVCVGHLDSDAVFYDPFAVSDADTDHGAYTEPPPFFDNRLAFWDSVENGQ